MTYAVNKSVSFVEILRSARWQPVKCTDPDCTHKAPILYACAVTYRGHRVRVVQDWDCYSAQVDGDPRQMVENKPYTEMLDFVEKTLEGA